MIENNNEQLYYTQDNETIHEYFSKLTIDQVFFIDIKSVNDEGMTITMVTVVAMVTVTIDILVVDMFQEDNTCVASLLQDLLSQEKPSLPGKFDIHTDNCIFNIILVNCGNIV